MNQKLFSHINSLYSQSDTFLASGQFGDGLWPVDKAVGQFLSFLIQFHQLNYGLEVGAGVGYSTAWLASAFQQTGGQLLSLEYFPPKVFQLEKNMNKIFDQEYEQLVQIVPSDFMKWFPHAGLKRFDFVFFDQRKGDYLEHLKLLLPKLKKGAYICADNVISHHKACRDYLSFVRNDRRFVSVCLPLGDGLEISRYVF